MTRVERMKLVVEYNRIRGNLSSGDLGRVDRMRAIVRANQVRALLGGAVAPPEPTPTEDPRITQLRDIAAGGMDNAPLDASFWAIESAVTGLNADDLLTGEAESVANAAITRWAENDEKLYG